MQQEERLQGSKTAAGISPQPLTTVWCRAEWIYTQGGDLSAELWWDQVEYVSQLEFAANIVELQPWDPENNPERPNSAGATLWLWWAEQKSHLQSAVGGLEVEDLIDQLLLTMSSGKEPKSWDCSPSPAHGSCHWGFFLLDCSWTTPPLSLACTHISIQRNPIRPFHMEAPRAIKALLRPIQNQANCHIKSNTTQDPKPNIFSCKSVKGEGGNEQNSKEVNKTTLHFRYHHGMPD